jgi:hypothetical protein
MREKPPEMTPSDDAAARNVQNVAEGASAIQISDARSLILANSPHSTGNVYLPPSVAPQKTVSGVPYNVPHRGTVHFVGRETELEQLHSQLETAGTIAISAIAGMGGTGKTELALQCALERRTGFISFGNANAIESRNAEA